MLTRRELLIRAGAAGAAMLTSRLTPTMAMASQPHSPVNFDVPKGAADCHTHIFDPDRFPYAPGHAYTPESASVDEMRSLHRALHTDHVVIVQPSVYGTDNSCTLDAIEQLGHTARGIAVIGEKVTQAELDQMHRRGIKGVRVNLETTGEADPALAKQRFKAAVDQIKGPRNWHVQIYTRLSVIEALKNEIATCPVRVSIDHMGSAQAALGVHQPGFATLVGLVRSGKAYVKVSAPYRLSTKAPDYADVTPLAKALIAANPQRILWGTDWPHPQQIAGRSAKELTPLYQIDDGRDFNLFAAWVPDAARRKTILVDNPAKLYGF